MMRKMKWISRKTTEKLTTASRKIEYEKFRRVVDYMETTHYPEEKLKEGRKDFYNWFTEYDRRRDTNFVATFPALANFYYKCKNE